MPVTQVWFLTEVPVQFDQSVAKDFDRVHKSAEDRIYNDRNIVRAWQNWCNHPNDFITNVEAYDIHKHYKCIYPSDFWSWEIIQRLFAMQEFDALAGEYMSPRSNNTYNIEEKYVIDYVCTLGNTAVEILFFMLGKEYFEKLPGFFGNFYVRSNEIENEADRIVSLFKELDKDELLSRGEEYTLGYNDRERVEEVLDALPNAFQKASEKKANLLGLKWTAG